MGNLSSNESSCSIVSSEQQLDNVYELLLEACEDGAIDIAQQLVVQIPYIPILSYDNTCTRIIILRRCAYAIGHHDGVFASVFWHDDFADLLEWWQRGVDDKTMRYSR